MNNMLAYNVCIKVCDTVTSTTDDVDLKALQQQISLAHQLLDLTG